MALGGHKNTSLVNYSGYSYEGKPIVLGKSRGRPIKEEHHKMTWWPDKTKVEAATLFAVTGDKHYVSETTGVPVGQIERWKGEPWWELTITRVQKDTNNEIDGQFTHLITLALEGLKDRFVNGDAVVNRKGEITRKPLGARDMAICAAIIFDKRQLVRGEATERVERIDPEAHLKRLKAAFEKLAKAQEEKTIEGVVIDKETEDASRSSGETPQGD